MTRFYGWTLFWIGSMASAYCVQQAFPTADFLAVVLANTTITITIAIGAALIERVSA